MIRHLMQWRVVLVLSAMSRSALASDIAAADPEAVVEIARLVRFSGVLTSVVVIAGVWFVLRVVADTVERLSRQFQSRRLLLQKIQTIVQFIAYIGTALVVVLLSFRLDKTVLTLIGGTLAVSVGFAVRDVVASFIAGIMIMIDRPFQVGDRVSFGGMYGDIRAIGLRSVRMQTLDDNVVTIPNNKFITDITSCGNYGALDMQVVMDFYIGIDQDVVLARDTLTEAALTSRYVHLPKPTEVLVKQVIHEQYVAVQLRLKSYVLDTRYEKAFETDVNLRVMQEFGVLGIRPPAVLHSSVPVPLSRSSSGA